jgi:hypothetical protein
MSFFIIIIVVYHEILKCKVKTSWVELALSLHIMPALELKHWSSKHWSSKLFTFLVNYVTVAKLEQRYGEQ